MFRKIHFYGIRPSFRRFLADSLLIILSVLFALFINEWRDSIKDKKRTEIVLGNIKMELQTNKEITERLIAYHQKVVDNMKAVSPDSLPNTFFKGKQFYLYDVAPDGVLQELHKDIAWEAAKQENITAKIDFATSKVVFEAYRQQELVYTTIFKLINLMNEREIQRIELVEESYIVMVKLFTELKSQEETLLFRYNNALEKLSS